ncbi:MAG: MFS transporter, partial [Dehalococcoidia bacterium]|nr:MFS transporter [Dehalococcoidia bacterium]
PSSQRIQGFLVLLAGTLTMVAAYGFARYSVPVILPYMRDGLGAGYGQMGMLVTANNTGYVISSFIGGFLSARFGPRRVIAASLACAGVATFATGFAPSIEFAIAMQFLAGVTAGGAVIPSIGLIAEWFEPRKRGIATGVMVGGFPLGILLSSIFLPVILTGLGDGAWRYCWMILGVLVVLLAIVDFAIVRDRPVGPRPDGAPPGGPTVQAPPLRWGLLYKSRSVWMMCAINITIGLGMGIFTTFFVAYLVDQRGLSAPQAAQAWSLVGLTGLGSGLLWGFISDKLGRRFGLAACYYGYFLALAILTFVPLPAAGFVAGALAGLTITGGMAVFAALLGDTVGPRLAAAGFGLISFFFNIGQVISPTLAGTIIDLTGSFAASLIAATVFSFLSATLCLLLRPPRMEDAL